MQVARRIRRTPVASAKKFFDFSIIIGIILGGYYLASHDWSKYSNLLKIRVENADALHGFVGGLGNSQYIRGVAFNTFKRKPKNRGEFLEEIQFSVKNGHFLSKTNISGSIMVNFWSKLNVFLFKTINFARKPYIYGPD